MVSFELGVHAASNIKLIINGKSIKTEVLSVKGTSYVPLRVVSENLGAKVNWNSGTSTITITSANSGSEPVTTTQPSQGSSKSYPVNVTVNSGPMTMTISKVTLDPAYKQYESFSQAIQVLTLDVTVENTSVDPVSWSPAYGVIVTNTQEQTQGYHYSDAVSGDFLGNVKKTGKLRFEIMGDLSAISSFKFMIEEPIGSEYETVGEKTTTEVVFK